MNYTVLQISPRGEKPKKNSKKFKIPILHVYRLILSLESLQRCIGYRTVKYYTHTQAHTQVQTPSVYLSQEKSVNSRKEALLLLLLGNNLYFLSAPYVTGSWEASLAGPSSPLCCLFSYLQDRTLPAVLLCVSAIGLLQQHSWSSNLLIVKLITSTAELFNWLNVTVTNTE